MAERAILEELLTIYTDQYRIKGLARALRGQAQYAAATGRTDRAMRGMDTTGVRSLNNLRTNTLAMTAAAAGLGGAIDRNVKRQSKFATQVGATRAAIAGLGSAQQRTTKQTQRATGATQKQTAATRAASHSTS